MSLLPSTLLNLSGNEDQTLEVHSEILEPLSQSQNICRFEIPHKNIMDSDSVLIWKVNWSLQNGGAADHRTTGDMIALPNFEAGLYDTIKRARLYVDGVIISELNEVGKYLTLRKNFVPQEVKVERDDFFSYANHRLCNTGGKVDRKGASIQRTPGDKELGQANGGQGHKYLVEASVKLHELFAVLKDAQLDTNNINGKIMVEIDWNVNAVNDNCNYVGSAVVNGDRGLVVSEPRLIIDFLTYNDEVQAQIKNTIFGDGPGVNMVYREVALVRKNLVARAGGAGVESQDFAIGMTGRAVQKVWVAKVMNDANPQALQGCRSDLLLGQKWNMRVNDLMIFDRDVDNRAEEFNYLQSCGEKQFTCPPSSYERRESGVYGGYAAADDLWLDTLNVAYPNANAANVPVAVSASYSGDVSGELSVDAMSKQGTARTITNNVRQSAGRQNYLAVSLAKYSKGPESPLNAMRIGSTPILFSLERNGDNDANTTRQNGEVYFWVEYLKMMTLKNGQVIVSDL